MMRVSIVGCPGTGKTTFSRKLGEATGLPVTHLDYYYHDDAHDYQNDRDAWATFVSKLAEDDSWILDGNYSSSFKARFDRADTIIFLDFPRRLYLYRNAKRRWTYRNKRRAEMPENWKEKADWNFIKYVWRFKGAARDRLIEALNEEQNKEIIIFKKPAEAEVYLASLAKK